MSPEKLEGLRALAADPRTPEAEARNAAILYVRNGGATAAPRRTPDPDKLGALEAERDEWRLVDAEARGDTAAVDRMLREIQARAEERRRSSAAGLLDEAMRGPQPVFVPRSQQ